MIEHKYQQKDLEGFDAGHRSVVRNNGLSRAARLLFLFINSFSSTKQGCYISNSKLAFYLGEPNKDGTREPTSVRSVTRWLQELRDAGMIKETILNGYRRRITVTATVEVGDCEQNEEDLAPRHPCHTPRTLTSSPHDTAVHIGNGRKELELSIPSDDGGTEFSKGTKPVQKCILPKDCLQALKNAGIGQDNIQRVAEHFDLIRLLAKHPRTTTTPRRCVAAARALETDDDWNAAEKSIPTAIMTLQKDKYLPGVETWLEGRMWLSGAKQSLKRQESPQAKTVRLFLDFASPLQIKRFFEKQAQWREYVKNTGCTPDQLAEKIQRDIEMDVV